MKIVNFSERGLLTWQTRLNNKKKFREQHALMFVNKMKIGLNWLIRDLNGNVRKKGKNECE